MNFKIKRKLPLLGSGLLGFLLATALMASYAFSSNQNVYRILKEKVNVLNQIITYVNHFYFDDVDLEKVMDGAFHGLMEELDPHSTYIPAKDQENIDELFRGNFQGIGIEFDILQGYITVISPIPDSPSDHVGLQSGDKIISINDEDAYKITKDEVFKKLRGKKGSSVDLSIQRIGVTKPFDVTIIRDDIPIYSVAAASMIDDSTGYIFLRRFSATTDTEVKKALNRLDELGMKRLVFDLRGNSGGFLEQAAAISNLFITTPDTLVFTKGKIRESNQVFMANPSKGRNDFSLIVLINRGSASASEIVAGAVQDLDRGLVVGETSFGKGLVQRQLPLEGGSALRVTIARYYTPTGRLIQRPYEDGKDHAYYRELYDKNREAKMDSLKELRPKYFTKSGRIVYGGGGITPDIYLPFKNKLTRDTQKVIRSAKRPIFNFGSNYASSHSKEIGIGDAQSFKKNWTVSSDVFNSFYEYLSTDSIDVSLDSLLVDLPYIQNRIKAEISSVAFGKDESSAIRIQTDNQVMDALEFFKEADAFLHSSH
ncbi:MAG: S41 family peptidase [Candidatus Marinimicrobia bacterium]|nr:S41 family peptidase [Candidatus Neomarinimicrobiota bacterium]MBT3961274.1 S41 family peptidase [Candidatus Neomarinimicrobiota bacterium]MBT4383496.1 S41 family peptidase [Candidatus Neomarinimicrobiota bacterium]MBT4636428.1 S41 family peptidase [Candidatus Neomarinimicrobiota bacterium]MBT4685959.1 S41 family peptidase [Candidatus Neomarinimicrobiota bacterium]